MTREELVKIHTQLSQKARSVLEKRNVEYATGENPFWNFEEEARFIEVPAEKVFLLYLQENLGRMKTMFKMGNKDKDQVVDKVVDIMNFAVLYYAWLESKENELKTTS